MEVKPQQRHASAQCCVQPAMVGTATWRGGHQASPEMLRWAISALIPDPTMEKTWVAQGCSFLCKGRLKLSPLGCPPGSWHKEQQRVMYGATPNWRGCAGGRVPL